MNDLMPPPRRDMPHVEARRAHLLRETRERRAAPAHRTVPRWTYGGLGAVLAAGGVAAAVALVPAGGDGGAVRNGPGRYENVAATEVFGRASQAAAAQPDLHPRADQFVYTRSKAFQSAPAGARGGGARQWTDREDWLSADGRRPGVVVETGAGDTLGRMWVCRGSADYDRREADAKAHGHQPKVDLADPPKGCRNQPAVRGGLPADAKAMRAWLYRHAKPGAPSDVGAFLALGDALRSGYIGSTTLAALFEAGKTIRGVTVTRNAVDTAGRRGIAVGQTWRGDRHELIFDPRTYRYLGERLLVDHRDTVTPTPGAPSNGVAPPTGTGLKDGTVLSGYAQIRVAITDRVMQPPR